MRREEEITRRKEQIKSNDLMEHADTPIALCFSASLFFYSSQMRRGRLDLTQFYEEKGSAQSHKGMPRRGRI